MIRKLQNVDINRVADLWLKTNLEAHDFISAQYWKHNFENRHYGSFLENELMEHWVLYEDDLKRIYTFQEKRVLLNEVLLEYSLDLGPEICQEINNYCNYLNFSYQSDTCGLYDNYWRCFFEMLSTCFDILVGIKNNVDDILYRQYSV